MARKQLGAAAADLEDASTLADLGTVPWTAPYFEGDLDAAPLGWVSYNATESTNTPADVGNGVLLTFQSDGETPIGYQHAIGGDTGHTASRLRWMGTWGSWQITYAGHEAWADITGKPAEFPPEAHSHAQSDITGLESALSGKQGTSEKNQANGYAGLDGSGKVAAAQLPSYVDDVVEAANLAAFPGTGETGKIYVALDTGKIYRWSGSAYVEISPSPGSTDSVTEGSTNLYYTTARARSDVIASSISNGDTTHSPSGDAVFDALALKQDADADLTTIAGLTATSGNFMIAASSAWASRTPAQALTAIGAPSDFVWVAQTGTRVTGDGDLVAGMYVGRAFTSTKVIYQFDTPDASGNTAVEVRRNGSQIASSVLTVSAANQVDGTGTDANRTATFTQSWAVGDRLALRAASLGTTPGKGLRVYVFGTWD